MTRALAAVVVLALAVAGVATAAHAQRLIQTQKLSAALANELVGESVAICAQRGYTVTAVVVDLDGVRQALLRGNGAPIHTLADRMAKAPPTTVPSTPLPNVTYAVGGVTIMAGGHAIGGIGVSGAPGGQFDEECARAAMGKVRARMK